MQWALFLFPLLVTLDQLLDKRLVCPFLQTIPVIIASRDCVGGLLLSELGGYLLSPDQAPAGTKRLNNLLHSSKLTEEVVEDVCAVCSSKAKRLTPIKPRYDHPPGRPIFVPGLTLASGHRGGSLGSPGCAHPGHDPLVEQSRGQGLLQTR